jgi:hypothetical protein
LKLTVEDYVKCILILIKQFYVKESQNKIFLFLIYRFLLKSNLKAHPFVGKIEAHQTKAILFSYLNISFNLIL